MLVVFSFREASGSDAPGLTQSSPHFHSCGLDLNCVGQVLRSPARPEVWTYCGPQWLLKSWPWLRSDLPERSYAVIDTCKGWAKYEFCVQYTDNMIHRRHEYKAPNLYTLFPVRG